jgi:hypothetical protein
MRERQAACSCRKLQVTVRGEPVRVSICHCHECQRRTGSVFAVQARFPRHLTTITGPSREFVRVSDEGETRRFHFCPDCGSTVYYETGDAPDLIAVPVGMFGVSDFPRPEVSVWEAHRHSWVTLPPEIEVATDGPNQ